LNQGGYRGDQHEVFEVESDGVCEVIEAPLATPHINDLHARQKSCQNRQEFSLDTKKDPALVDSSWL
jgi:hypothetical protein